MNLLVLPTSALAARRSAWQKPIPPGPVIPTAGRDLGWAEGDSSLRCASFGMTRFSFLVAAVAWCRISLLLVLLLLASACAATPETPPPQTGAHLQAVFQVPASLEGQPASHEEMGYLVWLPEGYGQDAERQWPLILFLHGAGSATNDSQFVLSYGLPEVLHKGDQPEDFPFVVVSPQAFPNVPWWEGDTLAVLNALLDEVLRTYQIDPSRVYLTGLSMGGYGSWWLATAYPDRFAAMVSVAGSGYRTPTPPGEETICKLQDLPVWAIHGAQDMISDPTAVKIQVLSLAACGGEVEWTLYPDAGHQEAYARAYRDPALYAWLLEHTGAQE